MLEMIQNSMLRTRQLCESSREHVTAVNEFNHLVVGARTRVDQSVQQSEASLQSLHQRLAELEGEMAGVLLEADRTLESVRLGQQSSQQLCQAGQAEVDAALVRLRAARQTTMVELGRDLARAQESLTGAATASETAALAVAARSAQLQAQLARARETLAGSRDGLEQQAKLALAEYLTLRDSLLGQMRSLEHQCEVTRTHTRASLEGLLKEAARTQITVDPGVCQRFEVELAEQMSQLSQQLGLAINELRSVTVKPRQAADHDVLAMMQKLRESFDPLERIAKVFHDAREAGLC